jgi:hypothetical protein
VEGRRRESRTAEEDCKIGGRTKPQVRLTNRDEAPTRSNFTIPIPNHDLCERSDTLPKLKELVHEKGGEIFVAEIGRHFPLSETDRKIFNVGTWCQLLSCPAVENYLGCTLVFTGKNWKLCLKGEEEGHSGFVEEWSEDELREFWQANWCGSQREFCAAYQLNQGNFSSWLSRRSPSDPASSRAVRRWLINRDHKVVGISLYCVGHSLPLKEAKSLSISVSRANKTKDGH